MSALDAFALLLRHLGEPLLLAEPGGRIVGANIAGADALGASVAALEGANIASFSPDAAALTLLVDGGAFPVRARDGRRYVCDASLLEPSVFLLRIAGGSGAAPRAQGFFQTLSQLHAMVAGVPSAMPLTEVCRTLLAEGMRTVGGLAGGVFMVDDSGANLELVAHVAYPPDIVERYRLVPVSAPIPLTHAFRKCTPVLLVTQEDYLTQFPAFTAANPQVALRGMACIPLELEGRAIGVIGLGFPLPWSFTSQDQGFLRALALQISHVMRRERKLEADAAARVFADRAASRLALLYTFIEALAKAITPNQVAEAIVDRGMAATGSRSARLWLLADDGETIALTRVGGRSGPKSETYARVPLNAPIRFPIHDAIQHGRPVWLESAGNLEHTYPMAHAQFAQSSELALACLPLLAQGRCIGGLSFSFDGPRVFLEDERAFLQMVCGHAAQAIERSRLYGAEQRAREVAEAAQRRSEFLADIGMRLSSSLDYASTLALVARAAVPRVADWCIVELEEDRRQGKPAVAAHVDADKEQLVRELSMRFRRSGIDRGIPAVIRTGRSELYPRITREQLDAVEAADHELGQAYRELGLVSSMVIPISARGRTLGAIVLNSSNPARHYDEHDLAMAEELGRRAGVAVDNARLYRDARDADRLKDEFLAMLSHELRNPLAPIVTSLGLMELRDRTTFAPERELITRNIGHVVRLVDDLLDVARIRHGKVTLRPTRRSLSDLIAKAIEMAAPLITERGHRLITASAAQELAVVVDEVRMTQAIANLVNNAAKYTEPGGTITVSSSLEGDLAVVRVRDTGIGIEPAAIHEIFDLFVQGQRGLARTQGGLGVGLTVVKSIVELHGGTVAARSEGLGMGSELEIRLPHAQPGMIDAVPSVSVVLPLRTSTSPLRVLVVDDNADAIEVLEDALSALGCIPLVAHDSAAALEAASRERFDLALLDIGLPVMDGYELARRLRNLAGADKVRLVALTGYGQASDRERSQAAGFDEHVVKPVTLDMLRGILRRCEGEIPRPNA